MAEFLELICRTSDARYAESAGTPLNQKIEFMLDELFRLVGHKRGEVDIAVEEQSASDDEY